MKTKLKRFNVSESIQRPGYMYESRVNLHHDAEPRAKVVLEGVAIFFFVRTGPVTTGTDSMPFEYFVGFHFQKIQLNEIHSMNLLHF